MLDSEILLSGVTVNAVTPIFCIPVQYSLVNILASTVFPSEFCMGIQNSISKLCIPQCIPIVDTACIHPAVSALKIYQWQRSGIPARRRLCLWQILGGKGGLGRKGRLSARICGSDNRCSPMEMTVARLPLSLQ